MFEGIAFDWPKAWTFLFVFLACEALCRQRQAGLYFPHLASFASLTLRPSYLLWFLKWGAIIFLLVALMSPYRYKTYEPEHLPGYAMSLVIDASASMRDGDFNATDRTQSRFDAARRIVEDFLRRRSSDSIGLVVLGTHAFVASPPTMDHRMLTQVLDRLYVGIAGEYTALYEAMGKAIVQLEAVSDAQKVVVVLSDGKNSPGSPLTPAVVTELAKRLGVRIYIIAIGDDHGRQKTALAPIAEQSGGRLFWASDAAGLFEVYKTIDALEKSPQRPPRMRVKEYFYIYPLFIGFLSLLLYIFLRNRRNA